MELQIRKNILCDREDNLLFIIKCLISLIVIVVTMTSSIIVHMTKIHKTEIASITAGYELKLEKINKQYSISKTEIDKHEYEKESYTEQIEELNIKVGKLQATLDYKNSIAKKMLNSKSASSIQFMKLYSLYDMTVDEMNEWIKERAPKNSPFIGRGADFIEAGKQTGTNPTYLAAHAALETGWGTSSIATEKHNYFGIGAFNKNTSKAYTFSRGSSNMKDQVSLGIIQGAKWIKENYIDKGQDSLYLMIYGNPQHRYYVKNDNTPDSNWMKQIASIMEAKPPNRNY